MCSAYILDLLFLVYFLVHIPIVIFVDSQAVLPKWCYPKTVVDLLEWYCREYKDSMMVDPPAWFQAFVYCEILFQLPFFILASYVFIKGINRFPWIRRPVLMYAAHTATTTISIAFHIFLYDFSGSKHPGPITFNERFTLFAIYSPFLIIPIMLLVNFSFRQIPHEKQKSH